MGKMAKSAKAGRPRTKNKGMAPKMATKKATKKGAPRRFHG